MPPVESVMLPLGTSAPDFNLPAANREGSVSLADFADTPLLLMFICNHCPFVKHIRSELAALGSEYEKKGVAVVAIMPNDVANYPDDAPEKMAREAEDAGYTFPYLYDESQSTAKAYKAACTPDFYVFDKDHKLAYRGQLDDARPKSLTPVTGHDVRMALDAILAGLAPNPEQKPSIGCSIKWKPGSEPDYTRV